MANLLAVAAARDAKGVLLGDNWNKKIIYLGENSHNSMRKAIKTVGLAGLKVKENSIKNMRAFFSSQPMNRFRQ